MTYWVSQSDGWHVVTTVDTVVAQDGDVGKDLARFSGEGGLFVDRPLRLVFFSNSAIRPRVAGVHIPSLNR